MVVLLVIWCLYVGELQPPSFCCDMFQSKSFDIHVPMYIT